ncbi:MAG: transposase, partial [Arenicella sp.]
WNPRKAIDSQIKQSVIQNFDKPIKPLLHFDDTITNEQQTGIPFNQIDYFKLVDWTGRSIRDDKRGSIPIQLPNILERLNIETKQWLINSSQFERRFNQRFHKAKASNNTS